MKKKFVGCMLAVVCVMSLFVPLAMATPITTQLNVSNVDLGLTGDFATVTVALTTTPNQVQFTVDANDVLLVAGSNFGIDKFGFNSTLTLSGSDFSLPAGWTIKWDKEFSDFGIFYAGEFGGGDRRDPLVFTVTNAGINDESQFFVANYDGYHYVAHIGDFSTHNGQNSAFFTDKASPVPEPTTMLLLGLGLLGIAGARKKFKK